jgi:hypothetical protein
VALETLRRESLRDVIGIFRLLEIVHVTARAFGGEALTIGRPNGSDLVAGVAVHHGVRANQRKAILVFIDVVDGNLPPSIPVARIALRGVSAAMDVGVAVLALVVRPGENQVSVAIGATDLRVHTAQSKSCFAVVKLRDGTDGFPSLRGVAVLAGNA